MRKGCKGESKYSAESNVVKDNTGGVITAGTKVGNALMVLYYNSSRLHCITLRRVMEG